MIGPRACCPPNVAREVLPELSLRERAFGARISSFDIAITWVTPETKASCVTPPRPGREGNSAGPSKSFRPRAPTSPRRRKFVKLPMRREPPGRRDKVPRPLAISSRGHPRRRRPDDILPPPHFFGRRSRPQPRHRLPPPPPHPPAPDP